MVRIVPNPFFRLSVLLGFAILTAGLAPAQLLPTLENVSTVASTVPANGDLNPYGVALIPASPMSSWPGPTAWLSTRLV